MTIAYRIHLFNIDQELIRVIDSLPSKEEAEILGKKLIDKDLGGRRRVSSFIVSPMVLMPQVVITNA